MKSLLATLRRIINSIIPDVRPGNINEDIEKIKKLIDNTHISQAPGHENLGGGFSSSYGPFMKSICNGRIIISDARQYVTITKHSVVYGYKSKYTPDHDRHHVELQRDPWVYIDDKSNITPGILLAFLQRYNTTISMCTKK